MVTYRPISSRVFSWAKWVIVTIISYMYNITIKHVIHQTCYHIFESVLIDLYIFLNVMDTLMRRISNTLQTT